MARHILVVEIAMDKIPGGVSATPARSADSPGCQSQSPEDAYCTTDEFLRLLG